MLMLALSRPAWGLPHACTAPCSCAMLCTQAALQHGCQSIHDYCTASHKSGDIAQARVTAAQLPPHTSPRPAGGRQRLSFLVPSRGMLGFKTAFATLTRGEGLLHRAFLKYDHYRGPLEGVRKGVLVATEQGKATVFAIGGCRGQGRVTYLARPAVAPTCAVGRG